MDAWGIGNIGADSAKYTCVFEHCERTSPCRPNVHVQLAYVFLNILGRRLLLFDANAGYAFSDMCF